MMRVQGRCGVSFYSEARSVDFFKEGLSGPLFRQFISTFIILANRKFSWLEVETLLLKSKPVTFFLLLDECRKLTVQFLPAAVFYVFEGC